MGEFGGNGGTGGKGVNGGFGGKVQCLEENRPMRTDGQLNEVWGYGGNRGNGGDGGNGENFGHNGASKVDMVVRANLVALVV